MLLVSAGIRAVLEFQDCVGCSHSYPSKTCTQPRARRTSDCGLADFLSRIVRRKRFRSLLETTDADSPASALQRPDDGRRNVRRSSLLEQSEILERNTRRLAHS